MLSLQMIWRVKQRVWRFGCRYENNTFLSSVGSAATQSKIESEPLLLVTGVGTVLVLAMI